MCGIVGAVSNRNVVPILLEGLRKLEYRGYDSAGLAVVNGGLHRLRSVGRVAALTELAAAGQARRASSASRTRAGPRTARPPSATRIRMSASDGLAVVHNGIIENHEAIRARLIALGYASPPTPTPRSSRI